MSSSRQESLKEIGLRLADMREIREMSREEMAARLNVSPEDYASYERGERDFQISFLCEAADILGIDVHDLMSGESPKLSVCTFVKKGRGYDITRNAAYGYKHLAFPFKNKKAEPFHVTVEPREGVPVLNSHPGQEFEYMVSGRMMLYVGDEEYLMEEGDSAYFDSSNPHALKALGDEPAKFLAIVIK
ncbi:MAG: helix-turn-helix transcriptional regulator [Clostridia bacterium]|nr:helix-turn-helix transcriptional regulator [Clostridia bacterium]